VKVILRPAAPHAVEDRTRSPTNLRTAAVFGAPTGNNDSRHLLGRSEKLVHRYGRPLGPLSKIASPLRLSYDRSRRPAKLFPILASLDRNVDNFSSAHGGDCLRGATATLYIS